MKKIKVATVFGTRPEAVKMGPLVKELMGRKEIEAIVCVTAQHRQMLDQVLEVFDIQPDYDLDIMKDRQTLESITTKAIEGLGFVFEKTRPDIVLVHGDTTTTFAGSLAAFYKKIKIGHVEAGLRTFDKYSPYPEEMNRKLTGALSDLHFAPTHNNRENLLNEKVDAKTIYITGNTVIDALKTTVTAQYRFHDHRLRTIAFEERKVITVTAHRRENLGEPLQNICCALKIIAEKHPDTEIVYPVHLNPAVKQVAHNTLGNCERVHLIEPLGMQDMHNLMSRSYMILTDSGGLQEEAPALGKPVLVLRNETERPEAVEAGTVKIAGIDCDNIVRLSEELLCNPKTYDAMAHAVNPYGDGHASERIVQALLYEFGFSDEKPQEFNPVKR